MSKVDELYSQLGTQGEQETGSVGLSGSRYRLTKKDLLKALDSMPESAAIWNTVPDQSPEDAKQAIKDALWSTLEPAVKMMVLTPTGEYVEAR